MLRRQRGYAAVLVLVGAVAIAGIASTMLPGLDASQTVAEQDFSQRAYLQSVRAALAAVYEREAAMVDAAVPTPWSGQEWLARAGVTPKFGLRVAVSDRIAVAGTPVAYRVLAAWLPRRGSDSVTTLNTATGVFSADAGVQWVVVSGQATQARRYASTLTAMQRFAVILQNRARAKLEADPARDIGVNYFRPVSGCSASAEEIPCLPAYVAASTVDFATNAGFDPAAARDAWGRALDISNTLDSQTTGPPYSMAIRATTPWGATFKVIAVQQVT